MCNVNMEPYKRSYEECFEEWEYVEDMEHLIPTYEEPAWSDMYALDECFDIWDVVWYFEVKHSKDIFNRRYNYEG